MSDVAGNREDDRGPSFRDDLPASREKGPAPRAGRPSPRVEERYRRPIIGIVPTLKVDDEAVHVAEQYEDAIAAMGGAPIVLPLTEDIEVYRTLFPMLDGFVLSGGNDVDPTQYGAPADYDKLSVLTPRRDAVERLVLRYAFANDVPTLGICRGMQIMNVFFGGTLYLDLNDQFHPVPGSRIGITHAQEGDYATAIHTVRLVPGTHLQSILHVDILEVNSMHHQGVRDIAPLLVPSAYSPDGLVEGIESPRRSFMIGVQWHPEYFPGMEQMGSIFAALVDQGGIARGEGRAGRELMIRSMAQAGCMNMEIRPEDYSML